CTYVQQLFVGEAGNRVLPVTVLSFRGPPTIIRSPIGAASLGIRRPGLAANSRYVQQLRLDGPESYSTAVVSEGPPRTNYQAGRSNIPNNRHGKPIPGSPIGMQYFPHR